MSKKNHQIDVNVEEINEQINNEEITVSILTVGKKEIGRVKHVSSNKYEVMINGEKEQHTKNLDDGYELIIRNWNLNQ